MTVWRCPVCGSTRGRRLWEVGGDATENGVEPRFFRPSADRYGDTVGQILRCERCGHGSLATSPSDEVLAAAYAGAADPASIDEEAGQVETARRALIHIERFTSPGRLVDVGCWTGSFVAAAATRGWTATGTEPSAWAVARAQERGLAVEQGDLQDMDIEAGTMRCVVMCDVLEHLLDVSVAIKTVALMLEPGGVLYLTLPDAGSRLARLMGQRWWSVLPMHVQYFTRASIEQLLARHQLRLLDISSHPKVFTAAYYAQRLGGYSPRLARAAGAATRHARLADRLVAPDFHDRMQVLATKD